VRETLVESAKRLDLDPKAPSTVAMTLRALSGRYGQAIRAAASL
jgi:hypothetical protein